MPLPFPSQLIQRMQNRGNRPVFGPYIPSAIIDNSSALGYIGGDALYEIAKAHPEFNYSCLVRNSEKGAQVAVQLPKAQLVYGELDDATTLEEQAKSADIVLSMEFESFSATIKSNPARLREF